MADFFDACRRDENKDTGKVYWPRVGLTLIRKGDKSWIKDERTGEMYLCFERNRERRPEQSDDDGDGVPF